MSTISLADIYGNATGAREGDSPSIQPTTAARGSEGMNDAGSNAPAISWVAFVAMLAVIRVLWERK